jgi:iron complex transport system permease protein
VSSSTAVVSRSARRDRPRTPGAGRRRAIGLFVALIALAAAACLSIAIGSSTVSPAALVRALTTPDGSLTDQVVLDLRLPRTVAAVVVGVALGLAGALIQAFTRNPLGDPGILGVDAGAALFVTIGVGLGAMSALQMLPWAFAGALVVTAVVSIIGAAGRSGPDPVRLTLAGVAVGAVLLGISQALMLLSPVTFARLRAWGAGSFVERGWDVVVPALPFVAAGIVVAFATARSLNALGLGDDLAASLGTRLVTTRALSIVAITVLAGSATAIAGPVGFVGLMAPHVARWIVGPDQRWILPYTMLLAPTLLLVADVIGRVALWPGEVPVGVVTAFIGAPVLIHLVRRARASTL